MMLSAAIALSYERSSPSPLPVRVTENYLSPSAATLRLSR